MARWLPLDEAAAELAMSRSALHRAVLRGQYPSKKKGRRLLVDVSSEPTFGLRTFIPSRGTSPGPSRDTALPEGAAARAAVRREALLEVELQRAKLELQDELERRRHERAEAERQQARSRALDVARVLLTRATGQPRETLLKFAEELDLLLDLAEPTEITPEVVANLFVRTLRQRTAQMTAPPEPEPEPDAQPQAAAMLMAALLARRSGLL